MTQDFDNIQWRCFLALEEELINTQNFVEFHQNNYQTFSIKYRSIILQACSEIDDLFKSICHIPSKQRSEILDYLNYFDKNHKDFFNIEILLSLYSKSIRPWQERVVNKIPVFWTAYNQIKHQGKLEAATLENALYSLCAVFSLLLAFYFKMHGRKFSANQAISMPKLFAYPGLDADYYISDDSNDVIIPGFVQNEEVSNLTSNI